jgi:hypothetical protein
MKTREQQINDTLTSAIKSNSLVEFMYDGKNIKVEPYLLGELYSIHQNHLEEGTFALRAWFVSGYSSQPVDIRQGDRWRVYHLEKIAEFIVLDETNKMVRPFYNQDDKDFKRINFRVQVI